MVVQVYHALKVSILTGLVVEGYTQSMYEYPYVMYNLPHSYMHVLDYTSMHGTFCSQWPRGCFSVSVTNSE